MRISSAIRGTSCRGRYWDYAGPKLDALVRQLPRGVKALGGVGNGVFEISEDLVGFESLAYLRADDPETFAALYQRIGDLMVQSLGRIPAAVRRHVRHLPLRR